MVRSRLLVLYIAVGFVGIANLFTLGRWVAPSAANQFHQWTDENGDSMNTSSTSNRLITTSPTQIIQQASSLTHAKGVPSLPDDYIRDPHQSAEDKRWCESRYGYTYLETLAKHARPFCQPEHSRSEFDCLYTDIFEEPRKDTLCLARNVIWDGRFNIDCKLRNWSEPDLEGTPDFWGILGHWYNTGPRVILDRYVAFGEHAQESFNKLESGCNSTDAKRDDSYKILIKREGGANYWHSLMEVFAFYFTIDSLQMAINKKTGKPYMSAEDLSKIQIIVLDDFPDGHFLDLFNYFSTKPLLRLKEFQDQNPTACLDNVIIPLAGATNPLWQGDWDPRNCDSSPVVDTLRYRVLKHFKISIDRDMHSKLNLTFIDRKGSRKLLGSADLAASLQAAHPNVNVNLVDMAKLTLREQISLITKTDVLVGVHGAGHTHGFFLPPQSSMVEILPQDLEHRGFRNLAALRGLRYFSDHATLAPSKKPAGQKIDWHEEDVVFDKEAFLKLADAAIQSVAHRGFLDSDVS